MIWALHVCAGLFCMAENMSFVIGRYNEKTYTHAKAPRGKTIQWDRFPAKLYNPSTPL